MRWLLLLFVLAACTPAASPPTVAVAPPIADESGFVASSDGVKIAYRARSSGSTAIVFVHCWSCDSSYWDDAAAHLAPRYRVVTLDLAGHGKSGRDRRAWTVEAFADDVKAVVDRLALGRVVLVGHSMGGPIIVEAAKRMPGKVVALVAVDTLADLRAAPKPDRADAFGEALTHDFVKTTTAVVISLSPSGPIGHAFERVMHDMTSADPAIAIPTIVANWKYSTSEPLLALGLPMRAIQAEATKTDVEGNRTIVHDYDVIVVAGVGHWLMLEAPDRFDDALDRSLASLHL